MKTCKHIILAACAAAVLAFTATGCDRTVSHTEKNKVESDGSVKTKESTVTEHPDGSVTKSEESKKTAPANP